MEEVATEGVRGEEGKKRFGKCSKCKSRWYVSLVPLSPVRQQGQCLHWALTEASRGDATRPTLVAVLDRRRSLSLPSRPRNSACTYHRTNQHLSLSSQHQQADWTAHRGFCKLLVERKRAEVVNKHRRAIQSWMASVGAPTTEVQL